MSANEISLVWEQVRTELQKLRGRNLFRGNELHLLPQRIIRIPVEHRGGKLASEEFVIHLTDSESALWAERQPGGELISIVDFGGDLGKWLEHIVSQCRGIDYLRTNSKTADYRKTLLEEQKNENAGKQGKGEKEEGR